MTNDELLKILSLSIRKDDSVKLVVFLCMLLAYTEDSQINASLNAPSGSGKTYIPLEIAPLFPNEDVEKIFYFSPKAFFHTQSTYH